jgi:hypothetical protein
VKSALLDERDGLRIYALVLQTDDEAAKALVQRSRNSSSTEGADAPAMQGATTANIGNI